MMQEKAVRTWSTLIMARGLNFCTVHLPETTKMQQLLHLI